MVLLRKPFDLEDLVLKIRAAREGTTSQQL